MKMDKTKVIRVVVLPSDVEGICSKCANRCSAICNNDIHNVGESLREDTPIIECYETGIKRIVTECSMFTKGAQEKIKVKGRTAFVFDRTEKRHVKKNK